MKTFSVVGDITVASMEKIFRSLCTPVADQAADHLTSGRYLDLVNMRVDPHTYSDVDLFKSDYLAVELASKFPFDTGIDRSAVAFDKFTSAEEACSRVAKQLRDVHRGADSSARRVNSVLHTARVKIERILPDFSWDRASRFFSFGPGACVGLPRKKGDVHYKYGSLNPSTTQGNLGLAVAAICYNREWFSHFSHLGLDPVTALNVVPGNKLVTVPKSAKTDRVIAIEPLMNMYIQKGIGGWLRRILKRVGVDLDDQSLNQELALLGSYTGSLATIDLSSASDSIALALVEELLPSDWVDAIKLARSERGTFPDGRVVHYHKVSSMGNGFTFELESLIFWAILESCRDSIGPSDRRIGVYGDDLIVGVEAVPLLQEVLSAVGFTFNSKKSFWTGYFRESCGKHFLHGIDVSPFYIREDVSGLDRIILLHNHILNWSQTGTYGMWPMLKPAASFLRSLSGPIGRKCVGPLYIPSETGMQMSDIWFGVDFDEAAPHRAPRGYEGWSCLAWSSVTRETDRPHHPAFIFWMDQYCMRRTPFQVETKLTRYAKPGSARHRLSKVCVTQWQGPGPWIEA